MEDIHDEVQVRLNRSPSKTVQPRKVSFDCLRRKTTKRLSTPTNNKHPLVLKMLLKLSPPSPVKVDSDQEQSKEGDIIQLRKEKYEINTPQRKISFSQSQQSESTKSGFEEQKIEEKFNEFTQSNYSDNQSSFSSSAQNILLMKQKDNQNCIPTNQAFVNFSKVDNSSLMMKRKKEVLSRMKSVEK